MLAISFSALLLSLACGVVFSAADYLRKAVPDICPSPLAAFVFLACQVPVLALWLWVSGEFRFTSGYWAPGIAVALIGLAANVLFIIAVRRSPLGLMIPLLSLTPIFTAILGVIVLDERLNGRQIAGMLVITAGLLILYLPGDKRPSLVAAWQNLRREPGSVPMAAVVLLWSLTPALDKLCVEKSSVGVHGLVQVFLLSASLGGWIAFREGCKGFRVPREAWRPLIGAAVTSGAGYILLLAAYQLTLVALVEVLKRTIGMLGALVQGRIFLHEALTTRKVAAVAVIAAGLPLVIFH